MTKVLCFISGGFGTTDVVVLAVSDDDGSLVAQHVSSSAEWAKSDIGITSTRKHDLYAERFPNGYELEWVDDWTTHSRLKELAGMKITGEGS